MYRYLFFNIRQTKIIALRLFSFSSKLEPELGAGAGPSKRLWLQPALQHYSRTRYQKSKLGMYEYIPYVPNYFCGNYFKSCSFFYLKRRSRSWPKSLTPVRAYRYRYIFLLELEPPRKSELVKKNLLCSRIRIQYWLGNTQLREAISHISRLVSDPHT